MRHMKYALCIVLTILAAPGFAAKSASNPNAQSQIGAPSAPINTAQDTEVMVLKEQVKLMRDYHSSLLDTVYMALGGVFTLAVLLAGFGWWSNFKVYENDKTRLKEDLSSRIKELEATLKLSIEANRSEIERDVSTKVIRDSDQFRAELSEIKGEFKNDVEKLGKNISEIADGLDGLKVVVSIAQKTIHSTSADLREVEENIWEIKKIPGNTLITQCQGLAAAIEGDSKHQVDRILSRMKSTIQTEYLAVKRRIPRRTLAIVDRQLSAAEKKYPIEVASVVALLHLIEQEPEPVSDKA